MQNVGFSEMQMHAHQVFVNIGHGQVKGFTQSQTQTVRHPIIVLITQLATQIGITHPAMVALKAA
ncbi:MAG: hypothetical protein ACI9LE_002111 [Paraglaciecola sp.]|jgi:hypothetical protein